MQVSICKIYLSESARRTSRRLPRRRFVLGGVHGLPTPYEENKPLLTMHDWEAKHYVLAAVIILVVMGLFAYSWA